LRIHLNARIPVSRCAERAVDTRSNATTVCTYAPSVTLAGQPRPTTEPWGYFTTYTEVLYLSGSRWALTAHSWPDTGLQGAGVAVAAQASSGAALPANSTATFDVAFTGAVNSGQPDSICTDAPVAPDGSRSQPE